MPLRLVMREALASVATQSVVVSDDFYCLGLGFGHLCSAPKLPMGENEIKGG